MKPLGKKIQHSTRTLREREKERKMLLDSLHIPFIQWIICYLSTCFFFSLLAFFEHLSLPRMTTAEEISSRTVTRALQGSHDIHSFRAQSVSVANHNLPHWQVLLIWEDASVILPVNNRCIRKQDTVFERKWIYKTYRCISIN